MKNFKKILVTISLIFVVINSANAQNNTIKHNGNRFNDLSYNYFYGKNSKVSVHVKRVIASDPKSSSKVLEILTHDDDVAVWLLAKDNLKNLL